ncbi:MAG: hypothetical protein Q8P83_01165 [bacterium]|nr:hypothetical protein [bacterium]
MTKAKFRHKYKHWQLKNTFFLLVSLLVLFDLARNGMLDTLVNQISALDYVGLILTGMFFVSTFTIAPAIVLLSSLAEIYNPFEIALVGGVGAVIGDYIIFRFLKDRVFQELGPLFLKTVGSKVRHMFHTPFFAWLSPVLGAIIISSPLPDEVGIGLLGISKLKHWQFIILSFILNVVGIFIVISIARSL